MLTEKVEISRHQYIQVMMSNKKYNDAIKDFVTKIAAESQYDPYMYGLFEPKVYSEGLKFFAEWTRVELSAISLYQTSSLPPTIEDFEGDILNTIPLNKPINRDLGDLSGITKAIDSKRVSMNIYNDRFGYQLGKLHEGIQLTRPETPLVHTNYEKTFGMSHPFMLTDTVSYCILNGMGNARCVVMKTLTMPVRFILTEEIISRIHNVINDKIECVLDDTPITEKGNRKLSISYDSDTNSFMVNGKIYSHKGEVSFLSDKLDRDSLEKFYNTCKERLNEN